MHVQFRWTTFIFGTAFIIKAALLFVVIPMVATKFSSQYGLNNFADGYDLIADTLARGSGYRFFPETALTLMREPGYPFFLAGIFSLAGYSLTAAKAANLLLAFGAAWLIVRLASRFSHHSVVTIGAPLVFLFHPGVIIAESRGGFEILFIFTLLAFVVLLYRARERGRPLDYLFAGLALGLAILVKSTPLLFPFFLLAAFLIFDRRSVSPMTSVRNVAIMVLFAAVVVSPWVVRNHHLTGKIIPTASVLGVSAHSGQYICKNSSFTANFQKLDIAGARERERLAVEQGYEFKKAYYQFFYKTEDEIAFHDYLKRRVVDEYVQTPELFLKCVSFNLAKFWFSGKSWSATAVNAVVQLPLLVLGIIGAFIIVRQGRMALLAPLGLLILYYWAVHLPIHAQARYSIPLVPFLAIPACFALAHFVSRFWRSSKSSANAE